jgi:ferrochelatase
MTAPAVATDYDAILLVNFGGPEGPDDVMPFLENVTRGRNIPRERLLEVAEHYHHFGGVSPINGQVRELLAVLEPELRQRGVTQPIYWGNRNWHPMLTDTVRTMTEAGVKQALGVVLAAYSSYSSCRQYRENILDARSASGEGAPRIDKMRVYYNHPDFIAANADRLREALESLPESVRGAAHVAFTAHSIPSGMAAGCDYEKQLSETARLVAEAAGVPSDRWKLVYQSRSGRPQDPWLEPDILDHVRDLHAQGVLALAIAPIGFLSDHMEVLYDLDEEAKHLCDELGLPMARAGTVGTHPAFVSMLAELIVERLTGSCERRATGQYGPNHDVCPLDCCPAPARPAGPQPGAGGRLRL